MATDSYASIIIAICALVVAIASFFTQYISHRRSDKSEQTRSTREIWDRIETQYHIIKEWILLNESIRQSKENRIKLKRAMDSLETELRYFVNRTEKGGIKEHDILEYYHMFRSDLENNVLFISKLYADIREYEETKEILGLIKKYYELTNKKKIKADREPS